MEFIETTKGARKLSKDGFLYTKNKTLTNGSTYWECSQRRSGNGCNVKITLAGPAKWFSKRGGQIISFLKKCRPPWLADEENFWVYFALDGLILNCFVWNKRLK